ncbi:DUF3549 family protein [Microbulbifer aggregans]|uniref:DUF3549 family protein n=1 Tax=Microbulbifer aggregans TaxID=1769779 RepID=UPI001CFEFA14|nr:DUF3549 family protein [Microbulbifer aggregans]
MTTSDTTPTPPATISELINSAEFNVRWFDLGRRVRLLPGSAAESFEAGASPWPSPYLRQAWCGLLLWPRAEENAEPVVWFLRLPLDEQGKLLLPIRDRFLRDLTKALAPQHSKPHNGHDPAKRLQEALEGSELIYTPPADRRAVFHAKAAKVLQRAPTDHFIAAATYAKDPTSTPWESLALQGIADLAVRWKEQRKNLELQMANYAEPVFNALCQCLESEAIDHHLTTTIIDRASSEFAAEKPDFALLTAAIRGISQSSATGMRQDFLLRLLESPLGTNGELLAAIGSRCCDDLKETEIAHLWLANLSASQPQETFNLLLTDMLFLPEIRNILLDLLRNPERPEAVARAFGNFLHPGDK